MNLIDQKSESNRIDVVETNKHFQRNIIDVCKIWKEVTEHEARPEREGAAIKHFLDLGLSVHEMRLLIEHHWNYEREKTYLLEPGNCNLRTIFNPARQGKVLDILDDLKARANRKTPVETGGPDGFVFDQKNQRMRAMDGAVIEKKILMKCGEVMIHKQQYDAMKKRWKNMNADYEKHISYCKKCL